MIDTVQIQLMEYDARDANLDVMQPDYNMRTGELKGNHALIVDDYGRVEGKCMYHRDGHFNLNISPMPNPDGLGVGTACFVRFEVPKYAHGDNYNPVDYKGTVAAFDVVQRYLTEIGVKANVKDAHVTRLDRFRNVVADEPFRVYEPVFSVLKASRMKERGYENGKMWGNGLHQVCAYDKISKMVHDKLPIQGLPQNTIRFEDRLFKASKIRKSLGIYNVRDLLTGYDHVCKEYDATMAKTLFKWEVQDVAILSASQIRADMERFKATNKRYWLQNYLMTYGMLHLLKHASIDVILEIVGDLAESRNTKARLREQLYKLRFNSQMALPLSESNKTVSELYDELKRKCIISDN